MFESTSVHIPPLGLEGELIQPDGHASIIIFAHGSGSSRHSPRNRRVAETLAEAGFGALLFDLLTEGETADRRNVFDIPLLAERLVQAIDWIASHPRYRHMPIGLFGASTGAAAALTASVLRPDKVYSVVSRGGRPDLAASALPGVRAPTLLIVGERDAAVIDLNREALARVSARAKLSIVPGASHLFEEPGALEEVARLAIDWFSNGR